MKRLLVVITCVLLLAVVAGIALWRYDEHRRSFYTDGSHIQQSVGEAFIRDVLWQPAVELAGVNSEANERGPRVSADGRTLVFWRIGADGRGDLFIAQREADAEGRWTTPLPVSDLNTDEADERDPALSPDGQTLLFSSDRPGGAGGYDVWLSRRGDFGWEKPLNLGLEVNGEFDERDPAIAPDSSLLLFVSNRPGDEPAMARPSDEGTGSTLNDDVYVAAITPEGFGQASALFAVNSPADDTAPVFSPAGDFVYFCSNRAGGAGFDIYRSRRFEGRQLPPEPLDGAINTAANETDPAPEMAGFALVFSSDRPRAAGLADRPGATAQHDANLWRSESREVFVRVGPRQPVNWAAVWAVLAPLLLWLLLLLLGLLLMAALLKGVRSRRVSLLVRCVLASIIAHMLLMILFTFWQVTTHIAQMMDRAGTQVMLTTHTPVDSLHEQIRGGMTQVAALEAREVEQAERIERDAEAEAPSPQLVEMQAQRSEMPADQQAAMQAAMREAQAESREQPQPDLTALARIQQAAQNDVETPQDAVKEASREAQAAGPAGDAQLAARIMQTHAPAARSSTMAAAPAAAAAESVRPLELSAASPAESVAREAAQPGPARDESARVDSRHTDPLDVARPQAGEATRVAEAGSAEPRTAVAQPSAKTERSAAAAATGSTAVAIAPDVAAERAQPLASAAAARDASDATPRERAAPPAIARVDPDAPANQPASPIPLPTDVAGPAAQTSEATAAAPTAPSTEVAALRADQPRRTGDVSAEATRFDPTRPTDPIAVQPLANVAGRLTAAEAAPAPNAAAVGDLPQPTIDNAVSSNEAEVSLPTDLPSHNAEANVAATQPGVRGPASMLAATSVRQGVGSAEAPTGSAVVLAPASEQAADAQPLDVTAAGAIAESSGDSRSPSTALATGAGGDAALLAAPMSGDLALPTEQTTGRDTSSIPTPTGVAARGDHLSRRAASVAGSKAAPTATVALSPSANQSSGEEPSLGTGTAPTIEAQPKPANEMVPRDAPAGETMPRPALATGEIALPTEQLDQSTRQGQPRSSDQPHSAAPSAVAARGHSDQRAASPAALSAVSPAEQVQFEPAPSAESIPTDTPMPSHQAASADARESAASASLPAMALAELGMPEVAAEPDFDIRIPTETLPPNNPYAARAEDKRLETVKRMGGSEETERAVAMALEWLARHQSPDGRWATRNFDETCRDCGGEGKFDTDIATTGLALLCFLGADHTHVKEGKYQPNVQRGLKWLLDQQKPDGDLRGGETMYSHGIASIALGEALGMTSDKQLVAPVQRAIEFINLARNRNVGGWRYEPRQAGDTSVAGWQVMAMMSAKRAGLPTPDEAFAAGGSWMETVSFPDMPGRYAYQPGQPWSVSMSAEGMFILELLGVPRDDARMNGSVSYILENLPNWEVEPNTYYWYYATLAMFQYQGPHWETWNKATTSMLLKNQRQSGAAAGSWDPRDNWSKIGGRVYQTAICTLCLEVYYRYLPMYRDAALSDAQSAVTGTVTNARTGEPLAGATVRLDLSSASGALVAVTDSAGRYALALPQLPADFVAISASKDGYTPSTTNIAAAEAANAQVTRDFALAPQQTNVIAIEADPEVHHLGNNEFEGAINSQFQKQAEGLAWQAEFTLGPEHLPPRISRAEVTLMVKGAQAQNSISINGRRLSTRMSRAPRDGSFGEFTVDAPIDLFVEGANTIAIRSSNSEADYDDFEFVNVQIRLE